MATGSGIIARRSATPDGAVPSDRSDRSDRSERSDRATRGEQRLADLALRFHQRKSAVELRLVGALLSRPWDGQRAIDRCRLSPVLFDEPDLRLMFCAVLVAGERGKEICCWLAKRALQAEGRWDDEAIASERTMHWGPANLADLACGLTTPLEIESIARDLQDLSTRHRHARALWAQLVRALDVEKRFDVRVASVRGGRR